MEPPLPFSLDSTSLATMQVTSLDQLTREDFSAQLKMKFRALIDAQTSVEMELVEVTPRQCVTSGGTKKITYESFALFLEGPADRVLPQRIYGFESAALGRFEIFIVPVGRDAQSTRYQATFNRQRKPA